VKKIVRSIAALWCVVTVLCQISPVRAEAATATLIGLVVDRRSALPVSDAKITLLQGDTTLASAATASDGRFRISDISPGVYDLTIRAHGYDVSVITALAVVGARETTVNVALIRSDTSVPSTLTTIGRVTTSTNQLLAATTLTQTISMQDVTDTGQIRFTDQLGTLPAVNLSTSSSVGDDVSLNLRGLGTAETATLLDGHPVGPARRRAQRGRVRFLAWAGVRLELCRCHLRIRRTGPLRE
jgi:hypothetical protein